MNKSSKTLWAFLIALVSVFGSSTVGWAADLNYDGNPFRLSTDKCLYAPGEQVAFNYDGTLPSGARVRYYRGSEVIGEESLSGTQWRWTAPQRNFTGYLAVVYVPGSNNKETIYSTIAVDVSSSWGKFPRYGFVATYDDSKTKSTIQAETSWLNRCHINGIQYYDWQYLHEIPYDKHGHRDEWTDLANRKIRADVVRNYISEHHRYGMKAMFYNLLFGADPGYGDRGVSWDWGMFKDGEQDYHPLPDGWRGPIYLCDPSNKSWQNYLIEKNNDVYEAFDFDGYHIDQLGYRGTVTNRAGGEIPLTWAYSDFINSMLSIREENGKLPVWELSAYETDCMIGYNSAPIIADAVARGIKGFDVEKAFEALIASSLRPEHGMESFRRNGLVLADDEHESVSKTLEFAYDDWCVAQVAKYLGKDEEYRKYMQSSQYWRNVLDPGSGFMRARLNGRWYSPFDPREVNNNYTEANSWQYSFFVPHDIPGLIEALGGKEVFEERLDSLFNGPEGTTGRTQADITGCIGQYAHGNEPSHHIPYLYDVIGRHDKAQAIVNQILETLYSSAPDGLCGNDDCGQMSAWYVLSSLGRYPVCPGAVSDGTQGTEFGNAPVTPVRKGQSRSGGIPELRTDSIPRIVTNPWFEMDSDIFTDSLVVNIKGEGDLYWRIVGMKRFLPYRGQIRLHTGECFEAYAEKNGQQSFISRCQTHKAFSDRDIELHSKYSQQYSAGGPTGLIDSRRGGINWRTGGWQGYQDTDFEAVVDLREVKDIGYIAAGFLQDARSWIWMPREVEFLASEDGVNFTQVALIPSPVAERDMKVQTWECSSGGWPIARARYVKVRARNFGTIPDWHPGAGYPAFIFVDEITIQW